MKRALWLFTLLAGLSACGSAHEDNSALGTAFNQIRGGFFNRGGAPAPFTATRASIQAAGITRPVMVIRFPDLGVHVGMVEFTDRQEVTIWRSLDGNTISTEAGVLRNTRGVATDLYSFETTQVVQAMSGQGGSYSRLFRGLDGQNQLIASRVYCDLAPEGPERIDVFGRAYNTTRWRESCYLQRAAEPIFENIYWQGTDGILWESRQWAGPEMGYAELERVIN